MTADDRLTTLDAAFVWFEHPGTPVHVGAVATFEAGPLVDDRGELRLDDLRERIAARLDALPRLRRLLAPVPYEVDRPRWVDDPHFDVARHVRELRLPAPGDDDALRRAAEQIQSAVLPRDRPLWDLHLVTGLDGDRIGLIERVHHALVDGVSGVDLATILLDLEPDTPAPPRRPWTPEPAPDGADLLVAGVRRQATAPVRAAVRALRDPMGTLRDVATVGRGLAAIVGDGLLAPRSSLNGPLRGSRRLAWVRADLDDIRAAGHRAGGSVNDVVLAAVAGGLRSLLLERGEVLPADLVLRVLVPVSLRRDDEHGALGNRVGAILAPLAVGIGDPDARLAAVVEAMRRRKQQPEADAVGRLLDSANALPPRAARILTRAVEYQPLVNLVVTNIPGPPVPLYAAGARMLEALPIVPLGANLTVGVAVLSYEGTLAVTLTADADACPDVDVLADGIERSLAGYAAGPGSPTR
ncbi:MAG: wax ester/triacylglycerol synthase family O-acyltransferase [Acidimicrobiales bacterium]|nr:wax ester/triacylglycerol synthase family O-acyltransferase [Acidimicrobiales bacterium]